VHIKHTGWEEMLLQEDRQRLAVWYVAQGDFGEKLKKWVGRGGESRVLTTPEMRAKVGEELAGLETVEREIEEGALQLEASRNEEYRRRTPAWWWDNVKTDGPFEDMLYECLRDLRWKFERHVTTYNLDKLPLEHKLQGIDAKMTEVDALVVRVENVEVLSVRVGKVEALVERVGELEKLVARVGKVEKLVTWVEKLEKPWFSLGADATAGAETAHTIGTLLGDLERLGGGDCF
jgi:hypothetical protein